MITKRCPKCETVKPYTAFHWRSDRPARIQSWCKDCVNRKKRERYNKPRRQKLEPFYITQKRRAFKRILERIDEPAPEQP